MSNATRSIQSGQQRSSPQTSPRVMIIGAGISGILMGIQLLQRGWRNFTILEKADTLGGTWRENVYPGAACDVPAHLYVYKFALAAGWRTHFADGADIWKYYHDIARRYGVLPYIEYHREVIDARFDGARWLLHTRDGQHYDADIVIAANGRLHHPQLPNIPGRDSFAGAAFHTARWDRSLDLRGKRVGLIGTGSTATQVIAAIAGDVAQLKIFQRTAQWVMPTPNAPIPVWRRLALKLVPGYGRRHYDRLLVQLEAGARSTLGAASARVARDQRCHDALLAIRDPVLRAKLTPAYTVGCKRLVVSGTYHEAVQKPGVEVITDDIACIEANGVRTRVGSSDEDLYELDVLVFATGFDAHAYLRPMQVTGADGVTLDEVWRDLPLTYRSVAIPHMPNFFLINGPYSALGTASVVGIAEVQVDYLLQLLDRIQQENVLLAPTQTAATAWLEDIRERARNSVWSTGGCKSWYLDATGTPTLDPSTLTELETAMAAPDYADFVVQPRG